MRVASFDYRDSGYEVRPDLPEAYREIWHKIGAPGNWWTGPERVAIVAESRASEACRLCAVRSASLSPFAVSGEHDMVCGDLLPASAIDAVHRISTDAARLTKRWLEDLLTPSFGYGQYIELLGVLVLHPTDNFGSVAAGRFRARRAAQGISGILPSGATPYGAFRKPPAGRTHKRPSASLRPLEIRVGILCGPRLASGRLWVR